MPPLDISRGLAAGLVVSWLTVGSGLSALHAQTPREIKDVVYATVDNTSLALDLYLPAWATPDGLVVWVHGGACNTGSKVRFLRTNARTYGYRADTIVIAGA
jgi:acetyl esterase/lipase